VINRRGYSWSGSVPELRRVRAVRELQHLDDASQTPQPAGMPLLRFDPADTEAVSEVQSNNVYFLEKAPSIWRELRKEFPGARIARLDREYGADERQYQERWVRRAGRWTFWLDANAGEGQRFSTA